VSRFRSSAGRLVATRGNTRITALRAKEESLWLAKLAELQMAHPSLPRPRLDYQATLQRYIRPAGFRIADHPPEDPLGSG
jgi:hypothetical protein